MMFFDNGQPPAGEDVVWQGWCYSERTPGQVYSGPYRWVPASEVSEGPSVEAVAYRLYEQIQGRMPEPEVVTSPPVGTDAIATVPVFFTVTNWVDELVEPYDLLGETVTVRATPELRLDPGEPGSSAVTCGGPGVPYDPRGGDLWEQAASPMACTHAYSLRTGVDGRRVEWPSTATVRWSVSWSTSTDEGASFPVVERSVAVPRGVSEVQAVVSSGGHR